MAAFLCSCNFAGDVQDSEPEITGPTYDVTIEVNCAENLIFSTYDVKIYVDNKYCGLLDHGGSDFYDLKLTEGNHTVKFVSAESSSLDGSTKIRVSGNGTYTFYISCNRNGIDIDKLVQPSSESSAASNDISETNISASDVSEPVSKTKEQMALEEMPIMKGTNADLLEDALKQFNCKRKFEDTYWGYGTYCRALTNLTPETKTDFTESDFVYYAKTNELLYAYISINGSRDTQKKAFLCMAELACSPEDAETVVKWVKDNFGKEAKTTIGGFSYEMKFSANEKVMFFEVGGQNCEDWYIKYPYPEEDS